MAVTTTVCPQCALEYSGGEVFCPNDGARLAPRTDGARHPSGRASSSDPLLGQILAGRYRIIRKIGEGGMGIVYEAEHVVIEKRVGLKVLREDFSSRPDVVERFRQEAKSASRIGHEHIIDISDFGETPTGASFFVMELLHGHDLAEELEKKGALSPRRTIEICLQCARALGAAHAKGIVHRDMKPENIFLVQRDTGEDFVKIVDFGIAKMSDIETEGQPGRKLTKTGMIFGTPEYMSPEQASGKKLDHRVDVYAMGVIMYELLTGRVPFVGDTFMGILTQHMFEQPPPLRTLHPKCAASPELERVIFRALAKNADERQQSMEELVYELSAVQTGTSQVALSSAPPPGTVTHHGYLEHGTPSTKPVPRLLVAEQASEFPHGAPAEPSRIKFLAMGAGAVLVLAAAAGIWALKGDQVPPGATAQQFPPPGPDLPAVPSSGATAPAVTPALPAPVAPVPAATPKVLISVQTEPAGATISVAGKVECEPTPCNFSVERDSLVRIEAVKSGYRASSTEVKAAADPTAVQLVLRKRSSGAGSGSDGELKIPVLTDDAFAPSRSRRSR